MNVKLTQYLTCLSRFLRWQLSHPNFPLTVLQQDSQLNLQINRGKREIRRVVYIILITYSIKTDVIASTNYLERAERGFHKFRVGLSKVVASNDPVERTQIFFPSRLLLDCSFTLHCDKTLPLSICQTSANFSVVELLGTTYKFGNYGEKRCFVVCSLLP